MMNQHRTKRIGTATNTLANRLLQPLGSSVVVYQALSSPAAEIPNCRRDSELLFLTCSERRLDRLGGGLRIGGHRPFVTAADAWPIRLQTVKASTPLAIKAET